SSSRRGGAQRRGGVVDRGRTTCPRHCRVLPSFTGGQRSFFSPPRGGGVARSAGVVWLIVAVPPVRGEKTHVCTSGGTRRCEMAHQRVPGRMCCANRHLRA